MDRRFALLPLNVDRCISTVNTFDSKKLSYTISLLFGRFDKFHCIDSTNQGDSLDYLKNNYKTAISLLSARYPTHVLIIHVHRSVSFIFLVQPRYYITIVFQSYTEQTFLRDFLL